MVVGLGTSFLPGTQIPFRTARCPLDGQFLDVDVGRVVPENMAKTSEGFHGGRTMLNLGAACSSSDVTELHPCIAGKDQKAIEITRQPEIPIQPHRWDPMGLETRNPHLVTVRSGIQLGGLLSLA